MDYFEAVLFRLEHGQLAEVGAFGLDVALRFADVVQLARPQHGELVQIAQANFEIAFLLALALDLLTQALDFALRFLPKGETQIRSRGVPRDAVVEQACRSIKSPLAQRIERCPWTGKRSLITSRAPLR